MIEFSTTQKLELYEKGFVRVPGVVPKAMVNAALRAINHSIGNGINAADIVTARAQSFCKELQKLPVITDLFNKTPAFSLLESVLGAGNLNAPGGGQVALRFPFAEEKRELPKAHIDGYHSPTNGVPKGVIGDFTALAVVLLSALPEPFAGNFTVFPGTHHLLEKYFREHGYLALLEGMPPLDYGPPHQTLGEPGDVIFTHYQLGHTVAPNLSPHVRYAIIFRLTHVEHKRKTELGAARPETFSDLWLEWPGIREAIAKKTLAVPA